MAFVLLIEDNQNNADYIIRILEGMGHEMSHALKGLPGARMARERRPDMILMDFNLPDIDGNVLILTLKKQFGGQPAPPIVAVTARNSTVDRQMAAKFGFSGFIGKPFEPEELISIVNALLEVKPREEG